MFYLTIFIPLSVSGKLTGTLSGFITCVKQASFGLLCAWREVLILRQHQYEATLQFTLMVVSIVENWDTMLASAQTVTSRLPRKTMVKGSDNQHLRYTMEVQILRSTRVNRIT
jgi:hypothetical protein